MELNSFLNQKAADSLLTSSHKCAAAAEAADSLRETGQGSAAWLMWSPWSEVGIRIPFGSIISLAGA